MDDLLLYNRDMTSTNTSLAAMASQGIDVAVIPVYPSDQQWRNAEKVSIDTTIRTLKDAGFSAQCPMRAPRDSEEVEVMALMTIPELFELPLLYLLNEQIEPRLMIDALRALIEAVVTGTFAKKDVKIDVRIARELPDGETDIFEANGSADEVLTATREYLRYLDESDDDSD